MDKKSRVSGTLATLVAFAVMLFFPGRELVRTVVWSDIQYVSRPKNQLAEYALPLRDEGCESYQLKAVRNSGSQDGVILKYADGVVVAEADWHLSNTDFLPGFPRPGELDGGIAVPVGKELVYVAGPTSASTELYDMRTDHRLTPLHLLTEREVFDVQKGAATRSISYLLVIAACVIGCWYSPKYVLKWLARVK